MARFGDMLRLWREENRYGTRALAKMIGISAATLNRFERGEEINSRNFLKIIAWCCK